MQTKETKIYYSPLQINRETTLLAASEHGLLWAGAFNEDMTHLQAWLDRKFKIYSLEENHEKLKPYIIQFGEYFRGERESFDFPLDLQGTPFQQAVWKSLLRIPYGQTATYTDIAASIGNPKSIRAVGTAIGKNPILYAIPCHRVINKNGKLGGFRGGLPLKQNLLQLENR